MDPITTKMIKITHLDNDKTAKVRFELYGCPHWRSEFFILCFIQITSSII